MNKNFEKLRSLAIELTDNEVPEEHYGTFIHHFMIQKKLCELVATECSNIIQNSGSYEETYLSIAGSKIKQHFGIE